MNSSRKSRKLIDDFNQAEELIRQQQQGFGKPIISYISNGNRVVEVGDKTYQSSEWKTFPDFLLYYLKMIVLGEGWFRNELKKSLAERHIIVQWYEEYQLFTLKPKIFIKEIGSRLATGNMYCLLGLAYNFYLLDHNTSISKKRRKALIKRLKNIDQFQGLYSELNVFNLQVRAGFKNFCFEDESDNSSKHLEWSASYSSLERFSTEVKARAVEGYFGKELGKNGAKKSRNITSKIKKHLNAALAKPSEDKKLIFIEINAEPDLSGQKPYWIEKAAKILEDYELKNPDKVAYVFIINTPYHRKPNDQRINNTVFVHGLNIPDLGKPGIFSLSDRYKQEQKHSVAYKIMETAKTYSKIPMTFDGSLPSYTFNPNLGRFIIGETYLFYNVQNEEENIIATIESAHVLEEEREIELSLRTSDNSIFSYTQKMLPEEWEDYQNHPEAFFGKIQSKSNQEEDAYKVFKFLIEGHENSSKENLLKILANDPKISLLKKMDKAELILYYCEKTISHVIGKERF